MNLIVFFPVTHLPTWFPGAGFLKEAKEWRPYVETMSKLPFDDAKGQLVCGVCTSIRAMPDFPQAAGKAKSSVVASLLSGLDDSKDNTELEIMIQNTAGTAYTGKASLGHLLSTIC